LAAFPYDRAQWDADENVFATASVAIAAFAVAPARGGEVAAELDVVERDEVGIGFENNIASPTTVAAGRTAPGNKPLAAEGYAALSTVATLAGNLYVVYEHVTAVPIEMRNGQPTTDNRQ
jgi:hypothetical protein